MQFYKLNQWPYVAVIDPFTGKEILFDERQAAMN